MKTDALGRTNAHRRANALQPSVDRLHVAMRWSDPKRDKGVYKRDTG